MKMDSLDILVLVVIVGSAMFKTTGLLTARKHTWLTCYLNKLRHTFTLFAGEKSSWALRKSIQQHFQGNVQIIKPDPYPLSFLLVQHLV